MREQHRTIIERVLLADPEALAKFLNNLDYNALMQLGRILERFEEEELEDFDWKEE